MSEYKKTFNGIADAVITDAIVFSATPVGKGHAIPKHVFTASAAWDTGSQFTLISQHIVEQLDLKPHAEGMIMGIGGDQKAETYIVHIGLPTGDMVQDLEVYCSDIDDYDVLIGMDIISLCDFFVTNKDETTELFVRIPSEGRILQ